MIQMDTNTMFCCTRIQFRFWVVVWKFLCKRLSFFIYYLFTKMFHFRCGRRVSRSETFDKLTLKCPQCGKLRENAKSIGLYVEIRLDVTSFQQYYIENFDYSLIYSWEVQILVEKLIKTMLIKETKSKNRRLEMDKINKWTSNLCMSIVKRELSQ